METKLSLSYKLYISSDEENSFTGNLLILKNGWPSCVPTLTFLLIMFNSKTVMATDMYHAHEILLYSFNEKENLEELF